MRASIARMRRRPLPGGVLPPTKTELKRQARTVQELADRLIEAPEELAGGLNLPDQLADALALARRITSRAALLRQRQFVGKLLRAIDCDPIRTALESESRIARADSARFRRAERWRDRLIAEGDSAIEEFARGFTEAEQEHLSRLVEAATAERQGGKPEGAGRKLFRWVRDRLTVPVQ